MMGCLDNRQQPLFYDFCLDDHVPQDHLVGVFLESLTRQNLTTSRSRNAKAWQWAACRKPISTALVITE